MTTDISHLLHFLMLMSFIWLIIELYMLLHFRICKVIVTFFCKICYNKLLALFYLVI